MKLHNYRLSCVLLLVLSRVLVFAQQPPNSISVATYGAFGNDSTDNTAAINAAIAAARSQGKMLYFPPGTYRISQSLEIGGLTVSGAGNSSILKGTQTTNFRVVTVTRNNSGTSISNLKVTGSVLKRDFISVGIFIDHSANFTIKNVTVDTGTGGIQSWGGSNGLIVNNLVSNTLADCFHNTGGSSKIIIANNTTGNCGDDMISVVSYLGEPITHNILIQDNVVSGQTNGRGITVVGGKDVTIQRNKISNSYAAGLLVASEPSYNTYGVNNVLVKNNVLTNVGNLAIGHAGLFVSMDNPGQPGSNMSFENNKVTNSRSDGVRTEGVEHNVAFVTTAVNNPALSGFSLGAGTNLYCHSNTLDGHPIVPANCTGTLNFKVTGSSLVYKPGAK